MVENFLKFWYRRIFGVADYGFKVLNVRFFSIIECNTTLNYVNYFFLN